MKKLKYKYERIRFESDKVTGQGIETDIRKQIQKYLNSHSDAGHKLISYHENRLDLITCIWEK